MFQGLTSKTHAMLKHVQHDKVGKKATKIGKFYKKSITLSHIQAKTTKRDTQTGAGDRKTAHGDRPIPYGDARMPHGDRRMAMGDTNY
ncbi:hypothetical protein [Ornithobacterium rhinotracheale]|uniref:hypothetical protein n=2 Tax=Ornithobacterium rhinotracheale TaxID=28251 RepID=UPI004039F968